MYVCMHVRVCVHVCVCLVYRNSHSTSAVLLAILKMLIFYFIGVFSLHMYMCVLCVACCPRRHDKNPAVISEQGE